jgi:hypothetical protein
MWGAFHYLSILLVTLRSKSQRPHSRTRTPPTATGTSENRTHENAHDPARPDMPRHPTAARDREYCAVARDMRESSTLKRSHKWTRDAASWDGLGTRESTEQHASILPSPVVLRRPQTLAA